MPLPYRDQSRVTIECPVCGLPHRAGALICDACGQRLDQVPDRAQMQAEYRAHGLKLALAAVGVVAMLALNVLFVQHVGGFVIATAPIGWLLWSGMRFRALGRRLARDAQSTR